MHICKGRTLRRSQTLCGRCRITHCAPDSVQDELSDRKYIHDKLTAFLEEVKNQTKFHYWLFGHYHDNKNFGNKFVLLYEQIVQVI